MTWTAVRQARGTAAIVVAALLGEYSLLIVPFIVTAMMQGYGLTEEAAGYLISLQLLGMAAAAVVISYLVIRIPPRRIAVVAATTICIANVFSALGVSRSELALARCFTGLGEGSMMAAAAALAAGARDPHKLFSALGLVVAVVASAALLLTPFLFAHLGTRGIFWLLAFSPIAVLVLEPWLPRAAPRGADVPHLSVFSISGARQALLAFALLWIGASSLWVFAERIGSSQGLSLTEVATFLAIGQVAGISGPVISSRFAERIGLRASIGAGSTVMALGGLLMVRGGLPASYVAGVSLLSIAIMFLTPCFRTLMAELDHTGGVVAMSAAFYTIGFGSAPLVVGGIKYLGAGYGTIAWLAAATFAASGILACMSSPRVARA